MPRTNYLINVWFPPPPIQVVKLLKRIQVQILAKHSILNCLMLFPRSDSVNRGIFSYLMIDFSHICMYCFSYSGGEYVWWILMKEKAYSVI